LASASPAQRPQPPALPGLPPFPEAGRPDPLLEEFLHRASSQLCRWLGSSSQIGPLPALSVLPAVEPEVG
jgi:hypothetical protein